MIEIVSIGDEILFGDTLNSNAAFLAARLTAVGLPPCRETCVGDDVPAIQQAVREAWGRGHSVIAIGGLGPTCDDLTREAVAGLLGVPLVPDEAVAQTIRSFVGRRGVPISAAAVRLQSQVPLGAAVLPNGNGTAPGLWCRNPAGLAVVMLPGPPHEFEPMVQDLVVPRFRAECGAACPLPRVVRVSGLPESVVEQHVRQALAGAPGATSAYCASPMGVVAKFHAVLPPPALDAIEAAVRTVLGEHALPPECAGVVDHVGRLLAARGWMLALAESCTGGMLASAITDIPGASAWFAGGIVSYANQAKHDLLDVSPATLSAHGAVSGETVAEMLAGARRRFAAEAAIAVSGIAGPGGAVPGKPVGTVFIGVSVGETTQIARHLFPGNRHTVRLRAMGTAFALARRLLMDAARHMDATDRGVARPATSLGEGDPKAEHTRTPHAAKHGE